jgi:glycine/D-amino acid oxidase-like deaminating enzyme
MGRRAGRGQIGPAIAPAGAWGQPPWRIDFEPGNHPLPARADLAIIGGGFTGLAAACWARRLAPERSVVVFDAGRLGEGASGRTGGIILDETAAGPLPGLGNVLEGFTRALEELQLDGGVELTGAWEIGRNESTPASPIAWQDSGVLHAVEEVRGGLVDPGRLLSGLAQSAEAAGALLCFQTPVLGLQPRRAIAVELAGGTLLARQALVAASAYPIGARLWPQAGRTLFTVAVATEPLSARQLDALSRGPLRPFYTVDLPYLWGRPLPDRRIIFGGGLVYPEKPEALAAIDVRRGEAAGLLGSLEERVRGLVPSLRTIGFSHRWGGPIFFSLDGHPLLCPHPHSEQILFLGGYTGQGVALSVYLARWAVEALLAGRPLPAWGKPED